MEDFCQMQSFFKHYLASEVAVNPWNRSIFTRQWMFCFKIPLTCFWLDAAGNSSFLPLCWYSLYVLHQCKANVENEYLDLIVLLRNLSPLWKSVRGMRVPVRQWRIWSRFWCWASAEELGQRDSVLECPHQIILQERVCFPAIYISLVSGKRIPYLCRAPTAFLKSGHWVKISVKSARGWFF